MGRPGAYGAICTMWPVAGRSERDGSHVQIPLDMQQRVYADHADAAVDALVARLVAHRAELVALGKARAFRDVGVHEYGDRTYRHDDARLGIECDEELADAIFYEHIRVARAAGDLPAGFSAD